MAPKPARAPLVRAYQPTETPGAVLLLPFPVVQGIEKSALQRAG